MFVSPSITSTKASRLTSKLLRRTCRVRDRPLRLRSSRQAAGEALRLLHPMNPLRKELVKSRVNRQCAVCLYLVAQSTDPARPNRDSCRVRCLNEHTQQTSSKQASPLHDHTGHMTVPMENGAVHMSKVYSSPTVTRHRQPPHHNLPIVIASALADQGAYSAACSPATSSTFV